MDSIENLIMTGGIAGWGILFIKSLFATEIEKKFMPKWKFAINEGILMLFFSLILGMLINVFIINVNITTSETWVSFGKWLLLINKIIFLITFTWLIIVMIKTKNLSKRWNTVYVNVKIVFLISGIIALSSVLFTEVPNGELKEDFLAYSIITGILCFLMFVFSIQGMSKTKPGYKVEFYGGKVKLNGLYFEQAIDKNRHIYLRDFRGEDKFKVFYLYYLSEDKIYKYEREEFYK